MTLCCFGDDLPTIDSESTIDFDLDTFGGLDSVQYDETILIVQCVARRQQLLLAGVPRRPYEYFPRRCTRRGGAATRVQTEERTRGEGGGRDYKAINHKDTLVCI